MISKIPVLDKAVNTALEAQAKAAGIDICNSGECQLRMTQTTFDSGEILWKIDGEPVLKLQIENLTEDIIVFTLQKIKLKKKIVIEGKSIIVPN